MCDCVNLCFSESKNRSFTKDNACYIEYQRTIGLLNKLCSIATRKQCLTKERVSTEKETKRVITNQYQTNESMVGRGRKFSVWQNKWYSAKRTETWRTNTCVAKIRCFPNTPEIKHPALGERLSGLPDTHRFKDFKHDCSKFRDSARSEESMLDTNKNLSTQRIAVWLWKLHSSGSKYQSFTKECVLDRISKNHWLAK